MYKKNLDYVFVKFEGDFYLYSPQKSIKLNESAARILDLCDGTNSIEDICNVLGKKYPETKNLKEIVERTINHLSQLGVLVNN
ncbi:PqqD family peptide modification chaperone [Lactobacillus helsingborgensis]|uniref:PqqD family peptide modification chaperone n=1 Tax=Lactobacillus helsingborgensis TaxID=1218494 RepID=UPI00164EE099|nr:PqqD family peptide modification chaperone [Lactobacillus helsingborgensis]MBC6356713.1 PqqD family peptide modification chaperone [Lactobacillus helsingborgensis]